MWAPIHVYHRLTLEYVFRTSISLHVPRLGDIMQAANSNPASSLFSSVAVLLLRKKKIGWLKLVSLSDPAADDSCYTAFDSWLAFIFLVTWRSDNWIISESMSDNIGGSLREITMIRDQKSRSSSRKKRQFSFNLCRSDDMTDAWIANYLKPSFSPNFICPD